MQYQTSYMNYIITKDDGLAMLNAHMNIWAETGWRLVTVVEHRVGDRGINAEHIFYWEHE